MPAYVLATPAHISGSDGHFTLYLLVCTAMVTATATRWHPRGSRPTPAPSVWAILVMAHPQFDSLDLPNNVDP